MTTKKIFLSQLPQEVSRLIEEFPELEVILKELENGGSGTIIEILNAHGIRLDTVDENLAMVIGTLSNHNVSIEDLQAASAYLRTDVDNLTEVVSGKADGILINGDLIPGNVNFKAGANIHMSFDETTQTVTIIGGGTNAADGVPVGTVSYFTSITPPAGWMECDGRILNAVEYPDLFNVIGTSFGAGTDGEFKLPDLRGEFLRGWDHGRGTDLGRGFGTHQEDELKSHDHRIQYTETSQAAGELAWGFDSGPGVQQIEYQQTTMTGGTETRPKNTSLLPFIRVKPVSTTILDAVSTMEGRLDTIEPIVNSNATQFAGMKSTVQGMDTRLTAAQQAISVIQTTDTQLIETVTKLQELITVMKSDLEEVKDIMASNYTTTEQFNLLQDRVTVLETGMSTLQGSLENLTTQVATLSDTANEARTIAQSVAADVIEINQNVSLLTTAMTDHETRIYNLEFPPVAPPDDTEPPQESEPAPEETP